MENYHLYLNHHFRCCGKDPSSSESPGKILKFSNFRVGIFTDPDSVFFILSFKNEEEMFTSGFISDLSGINGGGICFFTSIEKSIILKNLWNFINSGDILNETSLRNILYKRSLESELKFECDKSRGSVRILQNTLLLFSS